MMQQRYKIVFSGPMGAGKSQAISSISETAVFATEVPNTDQDAHQKLLTTVGIDYGEITLDDQTKIALFGTPGQERFQFIWPIVSQGALSVIILIDHTAYNPLEDLAIYLGEFSARIPHVVIGVTHVDGMPERPMSIYRDWLTEQGLSYPLFAIDARKREDVLLLIESIIASFEAKISMSS